MGQKVHPVVMRLGVNKNWNSIWYADKQTYSKNLLEDNRIRTYLEKELQSAGLEKVLIKRYSSKTEVNVRVARPGVVIGRAGSGIDKLKKELQRIAGKSVEIKVFEVKRPEISAQLVADNMRSQLERRVVPKFIAQRALEAAEKTNAVKGIRIWVSGRIKGAEIARTEKFQWGTVPLSTLRADIDYAYLTAQVPNAGKHGIKVWIYKGEKNNYEIIE